MDKELSISRSLALATRGAATVAVAKAGIPIFRPGASAVGGGPCRHERGDVMNARILAYQVVQAYFEKAVKGKHGPEMLLNKLRNCEAELEYTKKAIDELICLGCWRRREDGTIVPAIKPDLRVVPGGKRQ
jgi:hypothetical protein